MRTDLGVRFKGKTIVHPGAYDYIDGSDMTITNANESTLPIVIGEADAGKPGELVWLTPGTAEGYLRGGELLTAVNMMSSPIPEGGGGANIIGVIVANENAQAKIDLSGISVVSREYGIGGNQIQVRLEEGTKPGSKKFTAYRWDLDLTEVYDNVGAVFDIEYTGDQEYANLSIKTAGTEKVLITKIGADADTAVEDLNIKLEEEQFNTIDRLINYVSSISDYKVTKYSDLTASLSTSDLDDIESIDIKTPYTVLAVKKDLEKRINTYSNLVKIEKVGETVENTEKFEYLTGGAKGVTPTSWSEYLRVCQHSFANILVLLTEDASIHAEGVAYAEEMEQRGHRLVVFTGGGIGEPSEKAIERAKALNHSRIVSAYPSIYHMSAGKGKVKLPAYMTSALMAGRVAGVSPSEPITFDYFNVVGLVEDLVAGDPVIDSLLSAGVCTLERVYNGGIRLVQGITTYTSANNSLYRELSVRRGADDLSLRVKEKLEQTFVGEKGLSTTESSVKTITIDELDEAVKQGDIVAYDPNSIVVKFVRSSITVDYKVAPVEPINFILITSHFVPNKEVDANDYRS